MSVSLPPDLRLLLIDEDPLFRLGMSVWLNQSPDISLVAEVESGEAALELLDRQFGASAAALERSQPVNLVLLDVGLGRLNPSQIQGLNLCRLLKSRYPALPILCLSAAPEPVILAAARQSGADGYCAKSLEPAELAAAIRRIAAGQSDWDISWQNAQAPTAASTAARPVFSQSARLRLAPFRRRLRLSGIQQIEAVLSDVNAELQNLDLSLLDRAVLAGKSRELRAARWLVQGLLATPSLEAEPSVRPPAAVSAPVTQPSGRQSSQPSGQQSGQQPRQTDLPEPGQLVRASANRIVEVQQSPDKVQELAFDALITKLQAGLSNLTELPLEIDILREDKKRELLYLAVRKLEDLLSELRYSQLEPSQLPDKRDLILLDLWQAMLIDFFGKYYTVRLRTYSGETDVEVIEVLLRDAVVVQAEILTKIPGVIEVLQHLLFRIPLSVDSQAYASGNPESLARAELLLENLVIQLANAVMQPLLNHFANVETIKTSFYDRRLLSSREIERFRNNLSWRYRLERLYREPKNIFESQYRLFTLTGRGIRQTLIYAPRTTELSSLTGLPYAVTLVLETRDAVAPRLRSVLSFMGNSFVYVLTELVGRGIGLVGKGVLKGLGNVWQDTRTGRDRQR
ncbi:MAG: DUF3685 domain-containing protein [Pegethrix bostrychoides GSE-TBD4-15B]|jgi:DNA-binding NarL/FixJ family response regulator|uniref:DUF3685 domain-containing protein n=1 Tax=Pegethrix bostrychoides GSE-TBD4-15B TaxID=2839662 RepID=A0A951U5L9_9CYAN|nr:DUF3685 domain-containing protein [Pegethrix bostrychoides GSE-TBD4-15B]